MELKPYLQELVDDLIFGYSNKSNNLTDNTLTIDNIMIDSEKCLRLGLITNELITNSFKHAVPKGGKLDILLSVPLNKDNITFEYKDNGSSPTKSEVSGSSEGVGLLNDLITQLHGSSQTNYNNGYNFSMTLPLLDVN